MGHDAPKHDPRFYNDFERPALSATGVKLRRRPTAVHIACYSATARVTLFEQSGPFISVVPIMGADRASRSIRSGLSTVIGGQR